MSGDGNSSSSNGFDLNAFGDWGGMYNSLAGSSTPGTQGSATPATEPYQAPHFDLDEYYRPSPPPRPTQGLSQIRENFPEEHIPEYFPFTSSGRSAASCDAAEEETAVEEEEDLGRHPYSRKETMALYTSWLTVSYDPIVGNQQNRLCFWEKVTELYADSKPKGSRPRTVKMLRSHWDRVDKDVKKFCAFYRGEAEQYQSGASEADILRAAMRVFKDDVRKDFKHIDVWQLVRNEDRWAGGVRSSASKRTKHTGGGYSSSEGGGSGNASHEAEDTPTEAGDSSSGSRRRPQGTKAAKAARGRGRGKGKSRGESSQAGAGSGSGSGSSTSLWSIYMLATMADTSKMTPTQQEHHAIGMQEMARQLGLRPGAPPPTSGDDSPAE